MCGLLQIEPNIPLLFTPLSGKITVNISMAMKDEVLAQVLNAAIRGGCKPGQDGKEMAVRSRYDRKKRASSAKASTRVEPRVLSSSRP